MNCDLLFPLTKEMSTRIKNLMVMEALGLPGKKDGKAIKMETQRRIGKVGLLFCFCFRKFYLQKTPAEGQRFYIRAWSRNEEVLRQ